MWDKVVVPPVIAPRSMRVLPSSEEAKKLADWFGQQYNKSKSKRLGQLCKFNNVLTDENLPHSAEFHEQCEDYQLSKHKVFCLAFSQASSCADLLPSILFPSLQSDAIPTR